MDTKTILNKLIDHKNLGRDDAEKLMQSIMAGEVSHTRTAAILTALRMKGETVPEITGFVSAMRENAISISPQREGLVDTCGTGGDAQQTFNISTTAAFVAAGMGIPVAKHGNRSVSSKCGSSDVLEALGIHIDLSPGAVTRMVEGIGIGFLFAPAHHPAMKHVAPVRKELGIRTVFNILGPLANPANVKRQLIGVFDKDLTEVMASVLAELGSEKVFVVHGLDGLDEVSIAGETRVSQLENGQVSTFTFAPEDIGIERRDLSQISGGTAEENAALTLDILGGNGDARRDAVLVNAAFVAVVADRADNFADGARLAAEAIDSGRALAVLEALREASTRAKNESSGRS